MKLSRLENSNQIEVVTITSRRSSYQLEAKRTQQLRLPIKQIEGSRKGTSMFLIELAIPILSRGLALITREALFSYTRVQLI